MELRAAETFCWGKTQEFGEAGIEQVLGRIRACTHQMFIEYVLWAKMICVSLSCVLLPFNSEDSAQPSEV